MNSYREVTRNYVQSAKGVVSATDMLRIAMSGGDSSDIGFASELVSRAADDYLGNVASYEKFGFDEIQGTRMQELAKRERMSSDLLASALTDIEVANTLILAGRATGETPEPVSVKELEGATRQLDDLTNIVALPLGRNIEAPTEIARFGFDEVPAAIAITKSPDLATAKDNFEQLVAEVLATLIVETKKIIKAGFESVDDLDQEELAQAIKNVGVTAVKLPKTGKLIAQGLEITLNGLTKLTNLLGEKNIDALKEKSQELIDNFKKGAKPLDVFLTYSYGETKTKKHIADLLIDTPSDVTKIDQGAQQLVELQTRFIESMVLVKRIVSGLNIGKKYIGSILPQATAVVLFGAFYFVAMDYAVLSGMDYADTTTLIKFIEGVKMISERTLQ